MKKSQIIALDSSLINKPESKSFKGAALFSSLPPFYVPECLSINEEANIFGITFHYTNDAIERYEIKKLSDAVSICLGKKSGRIHEIIIHLNEIHLKNDHSNQANEMVNYMETLLESEDISHKNYSKNSFSATKSVFENYGKIVFSHAC